MTAEVEAQHTVSATPTKSTFNVRIQEPSEWIERLSLFAKKPIGFPREQRDDDALREKAFATHALESAQEGFRKLTALGVPTKRPDDFYAQMLKSDNHMAKVRRILEEKERDIRERAKRRNDMMQRKYKKELKANAAKKQSSRKRELQTAVEHGKHSAKKWRQGGGDAGDFDFGDFVGDSGEGQGSQKRSFRKSGINRKPKSAKKNKKSKR